MENNQIYGVNDLYEKYELYDTSMDFQFLWHYTSADGFMGIIKNKPAEYGKLHFWFTRSDCLNDASEGRHVLDVFHRICQYLLEQREIDRQFFNLIFQIEIPMNQTIYYPGLPQKDGTELGVIDFAPCQAFICSFSLKEDSLDMWRYYSKNNGGYALQLNSKIFDGYIDFGYPYQLKDIPYVKMSHFKVVYDDREKEDILKHIIRDSFFFYQKTNLTECEKNKAIKNFIQYVLVALQFRFKHQCFSSEQEYRFVAYRPINKPVYMRQELPTIKFRTQNGEVVPYIDLVVLNKSAYLTDVMISPYIKNPNASFIIGEYLAQCGFERKARMSRLPVR